MLCPDVEWQMNVKSLTVLWMWPTLASNYIALCCGGCGSWKGLEIWVHLQWNQTLPVAQDRCPESSYKGRDHVFRETGIHVERRLNPLDSWSGQGSGERGNRPLLMRREGERLKFTLHRAQDSDLLLHRYKETQDCVIPCSAGAWGTRKTNEKRTRQEVLSSNTHCVCGLNCHTTFHKYMW